MRASFPEILKAAPGFGRIVGSWGAMSKRGWAVCHEGKLPGCFAQFSRTVAWATVALIDEQEGEKTDLPREGLMQLNLTNPHDLARRLLIQRMQHRARASPN